MARLFLPTFTIFAFLLAASPCFLMAQQVKNPYENLDSFRLFRTLKSPFSQFAKNVSFKRVLEDLASAHQVSYWIDRRVDADQPVSVFTDTNSTVQSTLEKLAADIDCELAYVNQIVYFAPKSQGAVAEFAYWNLFMATHIETSSNTDLSWRTAERWQWTQPIEPLQLIRDRSKQLMLQIENLDLIEHDLWGPHNLPAGDFSSQWSCVLGGFGLTLRRSSQPTERDWLIESTTSPATVSFDYAPKQMASVGKAQFTDWKAIYPNVSVKKTPSGSWLVDASVAAHRDFVRRANLIEIDRLVPREAKPKSKQSLDNSRFSLKVQGTLGAVLEALGAQAGLEVTPWPLPAKTRDLQMTLDLKDVTLDVLLQSIAKQANIEIIRQDKKVTVRVP
jgi:hypothetical protein